MKVETSMLSLAFITAIILGFINIPILRKLKVGKSKEMTDHSLI